MKSRKENREKNREAIFAFRLRALEHRILKEALPEKYKCVSQAPPRRTPIEAAGRNLGKGKSVLIGSIGGSF